MISPGQTLQLWISPELEPAEVDTDIDDDAVSSRIEEEGFHQDKQQGTTQKIAQKLPYSLNLENANAMSPYLSVVPEGEWGLFCDHDGRVIAQQVDLVLDRDEESMQDDDLPISEIKTTASATATAPTQSNEEQTENDGEKTENDGEKPENNGQKMPKEPTKPNTVLLVSVGSPADWQSEELVEELVDDDTVDVGMKEESQEGSENNEATPSTDSSLDGDQNTLSELARMRVRYEEVDLKGYPCIRNAWYITKPAFDHQIVDDFTVINTVTLAKDVRNFLKQLSIPLGEFSKSQLNRTQGTLSDLLNHPKEWHNLSGRGKDIYIKMMKFLSAPNLRELVLKLRQRKIKRPGFPDDLITGVRPSNCLPDDLLLSLSRGEMPSDEAISTTASDCLLNEKYLARHCLEQLKYLGYRQATEDEPEVVVEGEELDEENLANKPTVDSGTQTNVTSSNLRKRVNGLLPKFLERHICTHFGCGAVLQTKPCFDSHMRCHAGIRTHHCYVCEKNFSSSYNLSSHMKVHDSNKISKREKERMIVAADETEEIYKTVHMTKHKKELLRQLKYICGLCWEGFTSRMRLSRHLLSQHRVGGKNIREGFTCYSCAKSFKHISTLVVHMRTHTNTRPFECEICKVGFHTKANLQRHARTHTGEKPFNCPICRASFTEARSVTVHMRTHTGERPYVCPTCGKDFTQPSPLRAHILTHLDQKPHLCELCGLGFRQKYNLVVHMKRHRGQKRHKCNECGLAFFKRSDCLRHMTRHLNGNEKQLYRCDSCNRSFTRRDHLQQHQKKHQVPPIQCRYCDKKFCDEAARQKHIITRRDEYGGETCVGVESQVDTLQHSEKVEFPNVTDKNNPIYIAAKALFNNEKHYIITAVSPFDNRTRDKSNGDETPSSHPATSGSVILTPCNQDGVPLFTTGAHSVFLQGVNISGQQLTMSGPPEILSQHSILFADEGAAVSDGSLRMALGADDVGGIKGRNTNMVEDSDPNMQSVIVETTEENIIISQDRTMASEHDKLKLGDTISAYQVIVPNPSSDNNIIIAMDEDQQVGMADTDLDDPGPSSHATLLGNAITHVQDQQLPEQQTDAKSQTYIVVDLELE